MFNKINDRFIEFLTRRGNKRTFFLLVLLFLLLNPLVFNLVLDYRTYNGIVTESLRNEKMDTAVLASRLFEERLDNLVNLGVSLATRVQFRRAIERGDWNEAARIIGDVPQNFSFLDRVFLTDPEGFETAAVPELIGGVGKNFAFRDWYKGVSKDWKPYVSEVYRREAIPQYNLVAIAAPIISENGSVLGILVLQLRLESLVSQLKSINAGESGFVYLVDQYGHVIGHPDFPVQDEIVSAFDDFFINDALAGNGDVGIFDSKIDGQVMFSAYYPIAKYGWSVVVSQPESVAFAFSGDLLNNKITLGFIFIILSSAVMLVLFRLIYILTLYRQRERRIFENIGDGVFTMDRNWRITDINDAALKILGKDKKDVVGRSFRQVFRFIRANDRQENIRFIEEAMLFKKTKFMENHTLLITDDGREVPVADSAAPLLDDSDQVIGAVVIFRDATKENEARQLRSDFAYSSHQLRTPVNQASWALEAAMEAKDREEVNKYLNTASRALDSTIETVDKIIRISEINQGMVSPSIKEFKLSATLDEVISDLEKATKERKVEIKKSSGLEEISLRSDPNLLKTMLFDVLENAIFYSPLGGKVEIAASADEDLLIIIRDSGIGIPAEEQPLVFTKFFRGRNFDKQQIAGAGLGLAICQEYAKLLGGKIWFKSKEGQGTTFYISIPLNN